MSNELDGKFKNNGAKVTVVDILYPPSVHTPRMYPVVVGAVLKKINVLGFGGSGPKIHAPEGHRPAAPLLSSKEKAASIIFLAHGHFEIWRKHPKAPKATYFWVRLMDFWPESPVSGVKKKKWIPGFFRASGNQESTFLHPRKVSLARRVPCPFCLRPERPLVVAHAPCMYCHCTPYCSYVTARGGPSGPSGPQHARRSERSGWPATHL
jgi:hypothetical protein